MGDERHPGPHPHLSRPLFPQGGQVHPLTAAELSHRLPHPGDENARRQISYYSFRGVREG